MGWGSGLLAITINVPSHPGGGGGGLKVATPFSSFRVTRTGLQAPVMCHWLLKKGYVQWQSKATQECQEIYAVTTD